MIFKNSLLNYFENKILYPLSVEIPRFYVFLCCGKTKLTKQRQNLLRFCRCLVCEYFVYLILSMRYQ